MLFTKTTAAQNEIALRYTLYNVHYTMYIIQCTLYNVQCTVCSVVYMLTAES